MRESNGTDTSVLKSVKGYKIEGGVAKRYFIKESKAAFLF